MEKSADIAVIGGGIVGLAHAYMASKKGVSVVLFEREAFAIGASVRNFGLLWPIGQEPGTNLDRALRSRKHWDEIANQSGIWLNPNGSLQLAYYDDELAVLEEFIELNKNSGYKCKLLNSEEVLTLSGNINTTNLKSALYSETEATVNPREAVRRIPLWLKEKFKLQLRFGAQVHEVSLPFVKTATETWRVQKAFVCSGADFQSLYPQVFNQYQIKKCKLQMMKAASDNIEMLGPTLSAGLTLRHYHAFSKCVSLKKVNERYNMNSPEFEKYGIHVLLAQNNFKEYVIGDSHQYAETLEPFDCEEINQHILNYLSTFWKSSNIKITERWHGIYPKMKEGNLLIHRPEKGVVLINGLGGAGMTLSFGLAEEIIQAEL